MNHDISSFLSYKPYWQVWKITVLNFSPCNMIHSFIHFVNRIVIKTFPWRSFYATVRAVADDTLTHWWTMIFLPKIQQHLNKICPTSYIDKFGKLLSLIFLTQAQNFSPCTMIHPLIHPPTHPPTNVWNVSCSPTVIDDIPELYLMMELLELHCISLEFIRPVHILLSISSCFVADQMKIS